MVPCDHPLRAIKKLADEVPKTVAEQLGAMHASHGRPSVPPARLQNSMLLLALLSIPSDRPLCERAIPRTDNPRAPLGEHVAFGTRLRFDCEIGHRVRARCEARPSPSREPLSSAGTRPRRSTRTCSVSRPAHLAHRSLAVSPLGVTPWLTRLASS